MKKRNIFIGILKVAPVLPLFFLISCFSWKMPEKSFFIISYNNVQIIPASSGRPYPYSLQVQSFNVQRLFNRQNIVYRYSPQKIQFYELQQWAVKPEYMMTDVVLKHFENSKLFNRVGIDFLETRPDYRLQGTVDALEKYDSGDIFFAHLAMSFKLMRVGDGTQVWSYSFDQRKQVFQKDMVYTIIGLSSILQTQMDIVIGQMDSLFLGMKNPSGVPALIPQVPAPAVKTDTAPTGTSKPANDIDESQFKIIPEKNIERKPK